MYQSYDLAGDMTHSRCSVNDHSCDDKHIITVIIVITKCPLVSQKVLRASPVTAVSELLRHPQAPSGPLTTWGVLGHLLAKQYFSTGLTKLGLLFLPFLLLVSKRLLMKTRLEGRRNYSNVPPSGPCWAGRLLFLTQSAACRVTG